jgi:hypothetical protein
VATLPQAGVLLLGNVLFIVVALSIMREFGRRARLEVEDLVDETDYTPGGGAPQAEGSEAAAAK